ncbi:hypothetical protein ZIOFF_067820 [Zingiber officinale]|uniref:Translin-associated protein X n=1 Tax=Zingiber officinale TaxID=94328 RepID=A0A8J5CG80_ZINOF|nr:hypothetical protein ZIOFF_067820 [Zingiber officinale]
MSASSSRAWNGAGPLRNERGVRFNLWFCRSSLVQLWPAPRERETKRGRCPSYGEETDVACRLRQTTSLFHHDHQNPAPPSESVPPSIATIQGFGKKPRTLTTDDSPIRVEFAQHVDYLNHLNDKRERVVKASRDVTMNSKKVIFQVHRMSKENREETLAKAENDLAAVTNQYMSKLVKELHGTDFWKLRRSYTFAVQEYVEAATLFRFCKSGTLLNLAEINASLLPLTEESIEPLQINVLDYLLGLADLTGELMRLAIGRISDGEIEYAEKICQFVRDIYRELTLLVPSMDDNFEMKKKMETMLQSLVKIENGSMFTLYFHLFPACFSVHVRGSEYIPLLGSADPDYSFLGLPDTE